MGPEPAGAPSPSEDCAQVTCPSGPRHPLGAPAAPRTSGGIPGPSPGDSDSMDLGGGWGTK